MTRREYEMTEAQLTALMEAMQPGPLIMMQCWPQQSQQERANAAWVALDKEMGFDGMSVCGIRGKGPRFFTAEPTGEPQ